MLCKREKEEKVERWEREIREVKTEAQIWEIVNRERKRRKGINERIEMEEWDEYFRESLGGMEWRIKKGRSRRMEKDEEEEIRHK